MNEELEKLVEDSLNLLGKALNEAITCNDQSDYRTAFICRHARSIYQLGQDTIFLLEASRLDSCPIIVRAMMESLFKLVAAVKKPEAAIQIFISEIDEEIAWMKAQTDFDIAPTIEQLSGFVEKLRAEHNVTSKKKWNTFECADAAGLGQSHYRGEYFVFSKHVHAMTSGILLREGKVGVGHVLQSILFIVPYAAASLAQVVKTNSPQGHVDEAVRLWKVFMKLADDDVFGKMDRVKIE